MSCLELIGMHSIKQFKRTTKPRWDWSSWLPFMITWKSEQDLRRLIAWSTYDQNHPTHRLNSIPHPNHDRANRLCTQYNWGVNHTHQWGLQGRCPALASVCYQRSRAKDSCLLVHQGWFCLLYDKAWYTKTITDWPVWGHPSTNHQEEKQSQCIDI